MLRTPRARGLRPPPVPDVAAALRSAAVTAKRANVRAWLRLMAAAAEARHPSTARS